MENSSEARVGSPKSNKIIFLDVDGPMIPRRAYYLLNQTGLVSVFDPCATALLLDVLKRTGAKLVISSTWGLKGRTECVALLEKNGISSSYLHEDWVTPRAWSCDRQHEVAGWLENHPEISKTPSGKLRVVVLDDDYRTFGELTANLVRTSFEDGMQMRHHTKMIKILGDVLGEVDTRKLGASPTETIEL